MSIAPGRKQITHERIVDTAARALCGAGFRGVGVADIMKQAGLTHGGFYAHFASRDALLAEALERAGAESRERMRRAVEAGTAKGVSPFRAFVESYLSERHLKAVDGGCPVAALASEMPRQTPKLRAAALNGIKSLLSSVQATLPADSPQEDTAIVCSQLVGALQLARAIGDNPKGRAMLNASRAALLAQFDTLARDS